MSLSYQKNVEESGLIDVSLDSEWESAQVMKKSMKRKLHRPTRKSRNTTSPSTTSEECEETEVANILLCEDSADW